MADGNQAAYTSNPLRTWEKATAFPISVFPYFFNISKPLDTKKPSGFVVYFPLALCKKRTSDTPRFSVII